MIIAVDASRCRSGGAKAHLLGIFSDYDPRESGVSEVYVWSYKELLDKLPERDWLKKKSHPMLEKGIFYQVLWQKFFLAQELRKYNCNAVLCTDAGTVSCPAPSVVMSRDMLSFEQGEMKRYFGSFAWLRLLALRYLQVASLRKATVPLFLTEYAAKCIQKYTGDLPNYVVIPHGISEVFRGTVKASDFNNDPIVCTYVSNADLYKHQWHVIRAVECLRSNGMDIKLNLVGARFGNLRALKLIEDAISLYDPKNEFVNLFDYVPHTDIPGVLRESDIVIFASSCENMPNTLIEAMASGVPIACSNRGPMPEVLSNAGVYFDPENHLSIAEALRTLINTPGLASQLAAIAHERAKKFSWKICAKNTWTLLASLKDMQK